MMDNVVYGSLSLLLITGFEKRQMLRCILGTHSLSVGLIYTLRTEHFLI